MMLHESRRIQLWAFALVTAWTALIAYVLLAGPV